MTLKEQIHQTKEKNPTWGYRLIARRLGCSHNLVKYHLNPTTRKQSLDRQRKNRNKNPLSKKLDNFIYMVINSRKKRFNRVIDTGRGKPYRKSLSNQISSRELLEEFKKTPTCYISGRTIDLFDTTSYHLDHIVPIVRGGDNSRSNLGLASKEANVAKGEMLLDEFLEFCREVLTYHGYKISKLE